MCAERRLNEATRGVWEHGFEAYQDRPPDYIGQTFGAAGALLAELRGMRTVDELYEAYWTPGDWPAGVLRRHLSIEVDDEALLELEHVGFWLRYQEMLQAR